METIVGALIAGIAAIAVAVITARAATRSARKQRDPAQMSAPPTILTDVVIAMTTEISRLRDRNVALEIENGDLHRQVENLLEAKPPPPPPVVDD